MMSDECPKSNHLDIWWSAYICYLEDPSMFDECPKKAGSNKIDSLFMHDE